MQHDKGQHDEMHDEEGGRAGQRDDPRDELPAVGAVLMSASTVIVAINARFLRWEDLGEV